MKLTAERRSEIIELRSKIIPNWKAMPANDHRFPFVVTNEDRDLIAPVTNEGNARFIAASPQIVDELLAEIERLQKENHLMELTPKQVREIRVLSKSGFTQKELGRKFGVHRSTIGDVITGKRWGHVQ